MQVAVVARHGGRGAGVAAVVILALDADRGVLERLPRRRDESAAAIVIAGSDEILFVFAQRHET